MILLRKKAFQEITIPFFTKLGIIYFVVNFIGLERIANEKNRRFFQ